MKQIILEELPILGKENPPYNQRITTDKEMKRDDIDNKKLYLVNYRGIYLLGRFTMQWFGWIFHPNLGSMNPQINDLSEIYEVKNLDQKSHGSTTSFIIGYLKEAGEL